MSSKDKGSAKLPGKDREMLYRYDVEYRYTAPGWEASTWATDTFVAENAEDAERKCIEWNERNGYEVTVIIEIYFNSIVG